MSVEIVTVEELEKFRIRLLADLVKAIQKPKPELAEQLMTSGQVRKILNISPGTLQKLRVKGILPYTKLDSAFRYHLEDVHRALRRLEQIN